MADGVYSRRFQTIAQMARDAAGEVMEKNLRRKKRRSLLKRWYQKEKTGA